MVLSASNVRERFGIQRMQPGHAAMRRLRRQGHVPGIHGNKHWPAADLLIDYLLQHPLPKRSRVLDIGCGWGLAGIFCARQFKAQVRGVDADPAVFPYLQAHAELNGVDVAPLRATFDKLDTRLLGEVDVILGSDICFWDEMVGPLRRLVKRAMNAGVKRVIIADPRRAPFLQLAEHCTTRHRARLLEWQSGQFPELEGAVLQVKNSGVR
jgi:predicted nicotinamide N-methyase